jgi:hypothetical protein
MNLELKKFVSLKIVIKHRYPDLRAAELGFEPNSFIL